MRPSCVLAGADATRCGEGRGGGATAAGGGLSGRRYAGSPAWRICNACAGPCGPRSGRSAGRGVGPGGGAAELRERLATQRAEDDVGRAFRAPASRGIVGASWAGRFVCRGSVVGLVGLGVYGPVSKKSGDELRRRSPSRNRRAAPPNGPSFPSVNPAAARGPDPLKFVKRIVSWGGFGPSTACLGPGFLDSAPIPPPETAPLAEISGHVPDLFGETTYAQSRRR
jgi:hypothetical protein